MHEILSRTNINSHSWDRFPAKKQIITPNRFYKRSVRICYILRKSRSVLEKSEKRGENKEKYKKEKAAQYAAFLSFV